jgi:hypothetical protein
MRGLIARDASLKRNDQTRKRPAASPTNQASGVQEMGTQTLPRIFKRVYTRIYSDSGQKKLYVEWSDGSITECDAEKACSNIHMRSLVAAAQWQGLNLEHEIW